MGTSHFIRMLVRSMLFVAGWVRGAIQPAFATGGLGIYRLELDGMTVFL